MKETSGTSGQTSLLDSASATSSAALEGGATRSGSPTGPTTTPDASARAAPSGPDRAHASLSARQVAEKGLLTSGTYGPRGSGSSSSAALTWSLASRLQAAMVSPGSILFQVTWKERATPSGRLFFQLAARAWPIHRWLNMRWKTLKDKTGSAYWPVMDEVPERWRPQYLGLVALSRALLTSGHGFGSWPTPSQRDYKSDAGTEAFHQARDQQSRGKPLSEQATRLAGWTTPTGTERSGQGKRNKSLMQDARLAAPGPEPTGFKPASRTGASFSGQLSPVLPCWLMGYPIDWILTAPKKKSRKKPE